MLLKFKLDKHAYKLDLDQIELGEAAWLEDDCGLGDLTEVNYYSARQLLALFAIAVRRANPDLSFAQAKEKVEKLANGPIFDDIREYLEAEAEKAKAAAEDPQPPAGSASTAGSSNGGQGKTRGKRGARG